MPIDLSKVTREELLAIHNEVLRLVAEQAQTTAKDVAAGHDSHGSNHSNNKMPVDFRAQIADILKVRGPQ
jgi:hypothetical protein